VAIATNTITILTIQPLNMIMTTLNTVVM